MILPGTDGDLGELPFPSNFGYWTTNRCLALLALLAQPEWKGDIETLSFHSFQSKMGQFRCEAVKQQAKNDLKYLQSLNNKLKDWNVTVPASIKSSLEVWEIWGGCMTQLGTPHFDDDRRVA